MEKGKGAKTSITVSKTKPKWTFKMTRGGIIYRETWFGYIQRENRERKRESEEDTSNCRTKSL